MPLETLVGEANRWQGRARSSLSSFLEALEGDPDTSRWPEWFPQLAALEVRPLKEQAARLLGSRARRAGVRNLVARLTASPDAARRSLGLLALGYLSPGDSEQLETLARALEDPEASVHQAASLSLGRLGGASPEAAALLLQAAEGPQAERALAGLTLLCDGRPQALEVLRQAATSPSPALRQALARALIESSPFPGSGLPLLETLLQDARPDVKALALAGLTRASARFPEAVGRLEGLAADEGHPLRLRALRSLGEAAAESPEARRAVKDILARSDSFALVALTLGLGVAARRQLDVCLPLLAQICRSPDPEVQATTAQVLADLTLLGAEAPVQVLFGLVAQGVGRPVLEQLSRQQGEGGKLAQDLLRLWTDEGDPVAPLAMARETLQQMGGAEPVAEIYRLLENLTHFATVDEILTSAADLGNALPLCQAGPVHLSRPLEELRRWVDRFSDFETETDPEAQARIIQAALGELDQIRAQLEAQEIPESRLLAHLAGRWKAVVLQTLFASRRGAELELQVTGRRVERGSASTLSLAVKNCGPGVAYQIAVDMEASPHYTTQLGSHKVPSLAAGESTTLDFTFIPSSLELERFPVSWRLVWSDFAEAGRTLAYAEEVVCRPTGAFREIPNPYIPGLPLEVGSELFLGRDDVFKFIQQNLKPGPQKRVLVLVGQRRMGKTSILKQLPLRLPQDFLCTFVDCQGLERQGLANLLYHLAYIIADAVQAEGYPCTVPDLASFQDRPLFSFEYGFVKPTVAALKGRSLLLLVDEFQALDEAVEAGQLDPSVFGFLRSLMQHQERLFFLFSGLQKRLEEARDYWQPVFNVALLHEVGLLDDSYARELIEKPLEGLVRYDPQALDEMLRLSCGHPYLTQLFCDRLVNHLNEVRESHVRLAHVQEVLPQVFAAGVNHFYSLWEDLSQREKIVLIAISADLSQHRFATLSAITRYLRERGIAAELEEVTTVLQQLLGRDLIAFVSAQPPGYSFKVLLFRYWIEKEMLGALVGGKLKWH
jgi:hypothetical protein